MNDIYGLSPEMPDSDFKDLILRYRDIVKQASAGVLQHLLKDTTILDTDKLELALKGILLKLSGGGGRPEHLATVYRHIIHPLLVRKVSTFEVYDLIHKHFMMPLL